MRPPSSPGNAMLSTPRRSAVDASPGTTATKYELPGLSALTDLPATPNAEKLRHVPPTRHRPQTRRARPDARRDRRFRARRDRRLVDRLSAQRDADGDFHSRHDAEGNRALHGGDDAFR